MYIHLDIARMLIAGVSADEIIQAVRDLTDIVGRKVLVTPPVGSDEPEYFATLVRLSEYAADPQIWDLRLEDGRIQKGVHRDFWSLVLDKGVKVNVRGKRENAVGNWDEYNVPGEITGLCKDGRYMVYACWNGSHFQEFPVDEKALTRVD